MHFCAGLPIILVACKKDLRRDPRVVDELRKTNQRPVTPEEVRSSCSGVTALRVQHADTHCSTFIRVWPWLRRLAQGTILSVLPRPARVYGKSSSTLPALLCSPGQRAARSITHVSSSRRFSPHPSFYRIFAGSSSLSFHMPKHISSYPTYSDD